MEGGDKHGGVCGGTTELALPAVGISDAVHFVPGVIRDAVDTDGSEFSGQGYAGADIEDLAFEAFLSTGLAVVPVGVVFLGGVVDEVLGGAPEGFSGSVVDLAPGVTIAVGWLGDVDFFLGNVFQRNQFDPRAVGQPAEVVVVGVGVGTDEEVVEIAEDADELALLFTAGAAIEHFAQRLVQAVVLIDEAE